MGKEVSNTPVIQTYFIYYKDAEITLASNVMGYQGIVLFVYTSIEVRKNPALQKYIIKLNYRIYIY